MIKDEPAAREHKPVDEMSMAEFRQHIGLSTPDQPSDAEAHASTPIDMILHCPKCRLQHIDEPIGEWDGKAWTNPPHRSHLCHGCGHIWRPADIATNGVREIATKGKADSPIPAHASTPEDDVERKQFPILNSQGAKVDYQLVADHGKRARENHYQTVERLAERGGLSWAELYAVVHDRKFEKIDTNEAIIAVRALEARYLAAIRSRKQEPRA